MISTVGKPFLSTVLFLCQIVLAGYPASALEDDPLLAGEFWVEISPFIETEEEYPLPEDKAYKRLLEEASFVFSGMIYGFDFTYTPFDKSRKVDEIFTLEPVAVIPWGDSRLSVVETRAESNRLYALIRYVPEEHQLRWLRMMNSNIYPRATGRGRASLFGGPVEKYTALRAAAKEAIRGYLRARIFNKPREVLGKLVFSEIPHVIIDAGEYVAVTRIRIDIDEIILYGMY